MIPWFRTLCALLILGTTTFESSGQDSFYSGFSGASIEGKVSLYWTINEGNTCTGTSIQRSSDGIYFEEIGVIDGICGNPESPAPYSFYDDSPLKNQVNFYRLRFGATLLSEVIPVEVRVYGEKGYLLSEHPVRTNSTLYFENSTGSETRIRFFSVAGTLSVLYTTHADELVLDASDFGAGMYYFLLEQGDKQVLSGRVLFY